MINCLRWIMIDQITELTNKTNEIEKIIQNFTEKQKTEETVTNCLNFSRNFSNLEIILPKKILIAKLEPSPNQNILLQCQIDLTLSSDESVEISLIAGNFVIYKTYKILKAGSSQISLMQNYKSLVDGISYIYVEIKPVTQKSVVLNHVALFVWGNLNSQNRVEYQAVDVGNGYLLSMLDNNCVYALISNRGKGEYNLIDFNFVDNSISYAFVYDSQNDATYFFRVDLNGNLFYSNYDDRNEIFLANGVSCVSADISTGGKFLVTYIKNKECYYFEIDENFVCSIHRKLYVGSVILNKVLCYFNSYRNKFILLLTNENNGNFMIEQIDEKFLDSETVTAQYGFFITTENID